MAGVFQDEGTLREIAVRYRDSVANSRDLLTDFGLRQLPEGHVRSRYGRLVVPGNDSTVVGLRVSETSLALLWLLVVAGAVGTQEAGWRLLYVLVACTLTLSVSRVDGLRRAAANRP